MSEIKTEKRFDTLDGMRGITAIIVMLYHFTQHNAHALQLNNAYIAVDVFFILSGFVLAHRYSMKVANGMGFTEFMGRRLMRLYPMFLMGTILGGGVFYFYSQAGYSDYSPHDIWQNILCNLLFIPYPGDGNILLANGDSYTPAFPINDPLWSLFFEMIASITFVWLVRRKLTTLVFITLLCLISIVVQGTFLSYLSHTPVITANMGWSSENFLGGFPRVFYGFACGMLLNLCMPAIKRSKLGYYTRKIANPLFLYCLLFLVLAFPFSIKGVYYFFVICLCAPVLICAGALMQNKNRRVRSLSGFLGWISYPVYCLHFPIGRVTEMLQAKYAIPVPTALTATAATIVLSITLSLCCEQPLRRWLSKERRIPSFQPNRAKAG